MTRQTLHLQLDTPPADAARALTLAARRLDWRVRPLARGELLCQPPHVLFIGSPTVRASWSAGEGGSTAVQLSAAIRGSSFHHARHLRSLLGLFAEVLPGATRQRAGAQAAAPAGLLDLAA
jgi:hypothetical protein